MKPTPSTPPATTEPELLKYIYPFSPTKPGQLFPSLQLTQSQKKSLLEIMGKKVSICLAYSTTYHYNGDEEIYCNAYDYYKNSLTGTLEALLGFSQHFLSHLVLGFSSSSEISYRVPRLRVIPLEYKERGKNITLTSLLKELSCGQTFFSLLGPRVGWEEGDIATLVNVPSTQLGPFFHALEHSYGHCRKDKRDTVNVVRVDNFQLISGTSLSRPCPYRFGRNDTAGILQQYLHRLVPKP